MPVLLLPRVQDWRYWAEQNDRSVYKIHKSQKSRDDEDAVDVVVDGLTHPNDVVIYHGLQQPQGLFALYQFFLYI